MLKKYKSTKIFSVVFHRVHVQQTEIAEKLNSSPVLSFFVLWREKKNTTKRQNGNLAIALSGNFSLSVRKQKGAKSKNNGNLLPFYHLILRFNMHRQTGGPKAASIA